MIINTNTELMGLLGKTLDHSFSPIMHNKAYKENNMNYLYLPIEIEEENIQDFLKGIKHMNFIGLNVTIPYKIKIMEFLNEIDPLAKKIGSVNTVKISKGKLIGFNTDGIGFVKALENEKDFSINKNKFLLIGAGGACRAIAMTLADKGAEEIFIANRTLEKAKNLSKDINDKVRNCSLYIDSKNQRTMNEFIKKADIIINTTSIGMYPGIDECPIDTNLLLEKHLVVDIVYNPVKTKLLKNAEKKGCSIQNGLGMLINQGAEAFEIWTEKKAPIEEMKKIINNMIRNQ